MKLGVISDTHQNFDNQRKAAEWLTGVEKAGVIAHLGDDSSDASEIKGYGADIISVPGVFEDVYKDEKIPNRIIREFAGLRIMLTHTESAHANDMPSDPGPEAVMAGGGADLVLCGHSHMPKIEKKGEVFLVNPGHLKTSDRKGASPSFAVVDLEHRSVRIVSLDDMAVFIRGDF